MRRFAKVNFLKYYEGDQTMETEIGWACSAFGRHEKCIKNLVGIHKRKIPIGRNTPRLEYNIKIGLQETVWENGNWIHLVQNITHPLPILCAP
jgi:hypothetical protein